MKRKLILIFITLVKLTSTLYSQELTEKEITDITEKIPGLILEHYVLAERRNVFTAEFNKRIKAQKYLSITNPDSLAKILTQDLREISNDKHLYVKYIRSGEKNEAFDWDAWEREERIIEKKQNFGFTEVKVLQNNIGYIKIVEFMHPQRGMPTAVAAMKLVENTDGLIIDIRDNGGGYAGLMNYVLNHYFEGGPTHISTTIYSDKDELPNKAYTSDLVYGKLRVNTPLFIITNERTGSAAEFFAYTLQTFGKAKIVGLPTAGAAHMNSFYPLNENFRISISTAAPINPNTNTNWENIGVIPDYVIKENEIEKALELIIKEGKNILGEE
jgi:retinol-binding protein 3